jgi:hypothetical protein
MRSLMILFLLSISYAKAIEIDEKEFATSKHKIYLAMI